MVHNITYILSSQHQAPVFVKPQTSTYHPVSPPLRRLDSDSALPFIENKTRLLQALERSDWPISQKDIVLLENEIKQGESYIQQAKELEEGAVTKGPLPEEVEGDGDKDNSDVEQSDDPQTKVGGSDSESYSDSFE